MYIPVLSLFAVLASGQFVRSTATNERDRARTASVTICSVVQLRDAARSLASAVDRQSEPVVSAVDQAPTDYIAGLTVSPSDENSRAARALGEFGFLHGKQDWILAKLSLEKDHDMKRFGVILAACLTVGVAVARNNEQASLQLRILCTQRVTPLRTGSLCKRPRRASRLAFQGKNTLACWRRRFAKHAPKSTQHHGGSVKVAFTVGASGRVVSHEVKYASDPALAATVG